MAIDTKQFKDKIKQQNPNINLVPLLDVIFTIMIFLLVVLSQTPTSDLTHYSQDQISAKPTSSTGTSEYYLLPFYTYIKNKIEVQLDNIEIAKKMSNWRHAEMKIWIETDKEEVIEALQESPGIIKVKEIDDEQANLKVAIKPNMLEKGIKTIIRECSDTSNRIVESKLKQ